MNRHYRVMIVDNNIGSFDRLRKLHIWHEKGFELSGKTASADEAALLCKEGKAELVIVFNRPPYIDPQQVIKAILESRPDIAFIAAGQAADTENMRNCFILGALDYLSEPISENGLAQALERAAKKIEESHTGSEYLIAVDEYLCAISSEDKGFVDKIKTFLIESESTIATTESAADWFGFNKDYFGRLFKSKLGITFGSFYKAFRISYAKRLLLSGRYRVYEVSEMLGFSSVDYFSSVFKKVTGKNPSEIKRL